MTLQLSLSFVTRKIVFTLQVVCNFASNASRFRQTKWILWLFHRSKFRIKREINIRKPSKERVNKNCRDYVIGREITTKLKAAVPNVILDLCDSCDCFASPLLIKLDALRAFIHSRSTNQDILAKEFRLFTIDLLLCWVSFWSKYALLI